MAIEDVVEVDTIEEITERKRGSVIKTYALAIENLDTMQENTKTTLKDCT